MKITLKIILFSLISVNLFGTAQEPDLIIYKGDTLLLYACPLELYPNKELIKPKSLFGSSGRFFTTGCWRGYVATWEIIDNKLYLTKIQNAGYPIAMRNVAVSYNTGIEKDSIGCEFANLKALFPDRYENGKVKADWVNDKLISPQGELLYYIHDGFASIYERELEFTIENGILIETKQFDNSKTKRSKYTSDQKLLKDFIYGNINYENLPKSDTIKRRVFVVIVSADDNGKIDSVKVVRGVNELYDNEAIRVVKSIPEWEVIYRHGKKISHWWTIPVIFDLTEKK
jgi:hypothetical protein